jgi:hypothetical protein
MLIFSYKILQLLIFFIYFFGILGGDDRSETIILGALIPYCYFCFISLTLYFIINLFFKRKYIIVLTDIITMVLLTVIHTNISNINQLIYFSILSTLLPYTFIILSKKVGDDTN